MRNQLTSHPIRTLGALLALAFVLFLLSGIPALRDAHDTSFIGLLSEVVWFGFLLTALAFVVGAGYAAVRAARRRSAA